MQFDGFMFTKPLIRLVNLATDISTSKNISKAFDITDRPVTISLYSNSRNFHFGWEDENKVL